MLNIKVNVDIKSQGNHTKHWKTWTPKHYSISTTQKIWEMKSCQTFNQLQAFNTPLTTTSWLKKTQNVLLE